MDNTSDNVKRPLTNAERQKRWRQKHPDKARKALRVWRRAKERKNGRKTYKELYARVKYHSKRKDLPFDIPKDYFLPSSGMKCQICTSSMDFVRCIMIDPYHGYVGENLMRTCETCYHMVRVFRYKQGRKNVPYHEFKSHLRLMFNGVYEEMMKQISRQLNSKD